MLRATGHMMMGKAILRAPYRTISTKAVKVLYGSQTGTAMGFAMQLGEALPAINVDADVSDLYEYTPESLAKEQAPVVFIVSCFGRGEPTDSARKFFTWLETAPPQSLKDLQFTVFGLGSSGTHKEYYNIVGRKLFTRLQELGATPIHARGEGDDSGCIEMDFDAWQQAFIAGLTTKGDVSTATTAATQPAAIEDAKPIVFESGFNAIHSENSALRVVPCSTTCGDVCTQPQLQLRECFTPAAEMQELPIMQVQNLTPSQLSPIYEMRLNNTFGKRYTTGDHVAVLPENSSRAVSSLCERMRWDPTFRFSLAAEKQSVKLPFTGNMTIGGVLSQVVDLQGGVTPAVLRNLANYTTAANEKEALLQLAEKDAYLKKVRAEYVNLPMLLQQFPSIRMSLDAFLSLSPTITPRYYSISSSDLMYNNNEELHITFRHLKVPTSTGFFSGLCSSYMAAKQEGQQLRVGVRSSDFRLPVSTQAPIIMVGGGIGIAPFKAFVEQRMVLRSRGEACGPAVLIYGARDAADLVYTDLFAKALECGAITNLRLCVGAADGSASGVMLPDRALQEESDLLWSSFSGDGRLYVCGGAKGFGRAIAKAVLSVAVEKGQMDESSAANYVKSLLENSKYLEDLAD